MILLVDEAGEWDRACYRPAYVRRFPFCLANGRVVCIVKSYIDAGGVPLYDATGNATAHWKAAEQLLEPFSMHVTDAPHVQVGGMARVAQARLRALAPARLKALVDKGFLGLVYAHLHSLENFSRLVARWRLRQGSGRR